MMPNYPPPLNYLAYNQSKYFPRHYVCINLLTSFHSRVPVKSEDGGDPFLDFNAISAQEVEDEDRHSDVGGRNDVRDDEIEEGPVEEGDVADDDEYDDDVDVRDEEEDVEEGESGGGDQVGWQNQEVDGEVMEVEVAEEEEEEEVMEDDDMKGKTKGCVYFRHF